MKPSEKSNIESSRLDAKILNFIRKHSDRPSGDADFGALALDIFRHQFSTNAIYRRFCFLQKKTPQSVTRWRDIPAMPAAGFKELVLTSFPMRSAVKVFKTSGTTQGSTGAHFFDTLKLYEAAILPPFKKFVMPEGGAFSFFFLMPSPKEAPHSSLSHMMGVLNRRLAKGKGRYYARGGKVLESALARDLGKARGKVLIFSTAFSLKIFLDWLKQRKKSLSLSPGSRLMETGGFKGKVKQVPKKFLYAECRKRLGIVEHLCVSEYGMTELSSQFYDTTIADRANGVRRRPVKIGPAWTRTLVIDPETGKETKRLGVLRHFDLANRGSVLAVQTEDLGRRREQGFDLIGRAPGADLRGCSLTYEEFLSA